MAAAAPDEAMGLSLVPEFSSTIPQTKCSVRAVVSLKAAQAPARSAQLRLQLVLDTSGSMSGDRIDLVKSTTKFVVDQMKAEDMLGVTAYASRAATPLPLQKMTDGTKDLAKATVDRLRAEGGTALYAGLEEGIRRLAAAPPSQTAVDALFMCTDGQANEGPQRLSDILAAIEALRGSADVRIPTVHCFGFGSDHDSELLEGIADAYNGEYSYLRNADEIPTAFADIFGGLLSCVAKDIKVRLTAVGGGNSIAVVRSGGRVVGASLTAASSGAPGDQTVAFADMFAEESRELLVELSLGDGGAAYDPVLQVDLEYTDVASGERRTAAHTLRVQRSADVAGTNNLPPSELVLATAARFAAADAIQAAAAAGQRREFGDAKRIMQALIDKLNEDRPRVREEKLARGMEVLLQEARDKLDQMSQANMFQQAESMVGIGKSVKALRQQRQTGGGLGSTTLSSYYDTASKAASRTAVSSSPYFHGTPAMSQEAAAALLASLGGASGSGAVPTPAAPPRLGRFAPPGAPAVQTAGASPDLPEATLNPNSNNLLNSGGGGGIFGRLFRRPGSASGSRPTSAATAAASLTAGNIFAAVGPRPASSAGTGPVGRKPPTARRAAAPPPPPRFPGPLAPLQPFSEPAAMAQIQAPAFDLGAAADAIDGTDAAMPTPMVVDTPAASEAPAPAPAQP